MSTEPTKLTTADGAPFCPRHGRVGVTIREADGRIWCGRCVGIGERGAGRLRSMLAAAGLAAVMLATIVGLSWSHQDAADAGRCDAYAALHADGALTPGGPADQRGRELGCY